MSGLKRCIFLAGAPRKDALSWDEPGLLLEFETPIQRFLGLKDSTTKQSLQPSPTGAPARWRSMAFDDSISKRPIIHRTESSNEPANFKPSPRTSRRLEDNEFLEHSIAILDDLDVSQIICTAAEDEDNVQGDLQTTGISFATTSFTDTSTVTTDSSFYNTAPAVAANGISPALRITDGIRDLRGLPKADYIQRIYPQTESVNLLVGIVNVSECRTVRLRRRNVDMDIIELTVGDETRAGFCITFWLVQQTSQKPPDDLRIILRQLRPGQVALLQNVALSSFKGNVYGQSLSRRFARNSTTVSVIDNDSRPSLSTPIASKLQRVQDWANDFVGGGDGRRKSFAAGGGNDTKKRKLEKLPPDTQD